MTHKVREVEIKDNYIIQAVFFDGKVVQYDVKQLFVIFPQFKVFERNQKLFENVKVDQGGYGISWNDELDLDAETIWEDGILIEIEGKTDINHLLAYKLCFAREQAKMTQKELSEVTGIYQADISKLERGIGNPSISTLNRLAEGMGLELQIDFVVKK